MRHRQSQESIRQPPLGIGGIEAIDKAKERHGKIANGALGLHVHILEMNDESYRLATSKKAQRRSAQGQSQNPKTQSEGDPATEI